MIILWQIGWWACFTNQFNFEPFFAEIYVDINWHNSIRVLLKYWLRKNWYLLPKKYPLFYCLKTYHDKTIFELFSTNSILSYFSFSKENFCKIDRHKTLLSTLLNIYNAEVDTSPNQSCVTFLMTYAPKHTTSSTRC